MGWEYRDLLLFFTLAVALQSCSLLHMGMNMDYGYQSPVYDYHNSTHGYSTPVSPTHMAVRSSPYARVATLDTDRAATTSALG